MNFSLTFYNDLKKGRLSTAAVCLFLSLSRVLLFLPVYSFTFSLIPIFYFLSHSNLLLSLSFQSFTFSPTLSFHFLLWSVLHKQCLLGAFLLVFAQVSSEEVNLRVAGYLEAFQGWSTCVTACPSSWADPLSRLAILNVFVCLFLCFKLCPVQTSSF